MGHSYPFLCATRSGLDDPEAFGDSENEADFGELDEPLHCLRPDDDFKDLETGSCEAHDRTTNISTGVKSTNDDSLGPSRSDFE